jgi:hypothetical protein
MAVSILTFTSECISNTNLNSGHSHTPVMERCRDRLKSGFVYIRRNVSLKISYSIK